MTRASDGERERALVVLRRHYAAGRIDADELEERVALATRARYRHELARTVADLPREGAGARAAGFAAAVNRMVLRIHAGTFAAINGALIGTWALTGGGDFWPAWVLVPWGSLLVGHAWFSRTVRRLLRAPRRRAV